MASEVKWIKIVTDIFDDEKILIIESMPDGDSMIVVWFKLLCLAGKQNNSGVFILGRMPYNDEMFAAIFRRPLTTVRLAFKTFEQLGMIEIINDAVTIPNWGKHQNLEAVELAKQATRMRVAKYRAQQKKLTECDGVTEVLQGVTVTECNADRIRIENKNKEKELDKEKDIVCTERQSRSMPTVFELPLNNGSKHGITQADIDEYRALYPAVDVDQEIRKMIGWLNANPERRKTKRGIKAFVNRWLSNQQDNASVSRQKAKSYRPDSDVYDVNENPFE